MDLCEYLLLRLKQNNFYQSGHQLIYNRCVKPDELSRAQPEGGPSTISRGSEVTLWLIRYLFDRELEGGDLFLKS